MIYFIMIYFITFLINFEPRPQQIRITIAYLVVKPLSALQNPGPVL
jgi:hypothetical protein